MSARLRTLALGLAIAAGAAVAAAGADEQKPSPSPAPAPGAQAARPSAEDVERAKAAVELLRRADDEEARRQLYVLGPAALGPLAGAVEAEEDPAAWSRLAAALEGILRARLQEVESRLGRIERDRAERLRKGEPVPPIEAAVEELARGIEADVAAAGYAAARELAREGGARDEVSLAIRQRLIQEVARRLAEEVAAADDEGRGRIAARLARLGPLAMPLVQALARVGEAPAGGAGGTPAVEERVRSVALRARDAAAARYAALLSAESQAARDFAAEGYFGLGELARPALEKLAKEGTPDERHRAERLLARIKWGISEELYRRTGTLLEGFEDLSWRERRMIAFELEKQGGAEAIPTLRRIVERDPSDGVKAVAAESLARLGDPIGPMILARLGQKPLAQSPEVAAAIAMDQGIRYLGIRRFDRAIAEFNRVLAVQPENEIALYNLACAYALMGEADRAIEFLERSVAAGFRSAEHMEKDEDLKSLREDARYKKILARLRAMEESDGADGER